jgi:aminotransferase
MINVFQPTLEEDELDAVRRVFESNWIGRGKKVLEFEAAWAKHIDTRPNHIVSTTCATEALIQAVALAGVFPGDEVVIPTVHFIGALNAILLNNGTPVFCDVDERTLNATPEQVLGKVTKHTKAVILLNYGGVPCDIARIRDWLPDSVEIIEDAACSPASLWQGKPPAHWADYSCYSLDAMKIITSGDGGILYCRNSSDTQLSRKLLYLGMDTVSGFNNNRDTRWWEFTTRIAGRRAIMNDITAAIGLVQLGKLAYFVDRRKVITEIYNEQLAGIDGLLLPPPIPAQAVSSYYLYWVQTARRDELAKYLRDNGIYTTFRYYPLHLATKNGGRYPGAERAANFTLNLPLHQGLSGGDVELVCDKVRAFYAH